MSAAPFVSFRSEDPILDELMAAADRAAEEAEVDEPVWPSDVSHETEQEGPS